MGTDAPALENLATPPVQSGQGQGGGTPGNGPIVEHGGASAGDLLAQADAKATPTPAPKNSNGASLTIYVDLTNAPPGFNLEKVQANLRKILSDAGVDSSKVLLVASKTSPDKLGVGPKYDGSKLRSYTSSIVFVGGKPHWIGSSSGTGTTRISLEGLKRAAATHGKVVWDISFANVIAHEVLWLSLFGKVDDPNAPEGSLASGRSKPTQLLKLSEAEAAKLRDLLGKSP